MKLNLQSKRLQIKVDRAQTSLLGITVLATVVTIFSIVSIKALLTQFNFQNNVIGARHTAAKQLRANVQVARQLASQYNDVFIGSSPTNVLGGKNDPSPDAIPPDGDNGRIVLDALPTAYDFPALLTSLSKLMAQDSIGSPSIGGTDQSQTANNQPSSTPQASNIDVTINGTAPYKNVQDMIKDLERSIRPFDITKLSLNGSDANMSVAIAVSTYYQPAKTLNLNTKEVH